MDSDTDAEENDDAPHTVPEAVSPPENKTRTAIPAGIPSDSDTDVEDKYALEAVPMAKSTSMQSKTTAEAGPTTHLKHFHLDSDTESEEDDPKPAQNNSSFKITETPTKLPETVPAALPRPDSETDDEAVPAVAAGKSGGTEPGPAADTHADLDILSDSGTDVDPESPLVKQTLVGTDVSLAHGAASEAVQSDSDADTDVEESSTAPVLERVTTAGLHEEGQKAVGDEGPAGASGEGQVPRLVGEDPPGLLSSSRQYCSTPVQLPGAATPTLGTKTLAFDSESQEDGNVFGAETQPFVFQPGARQAGGSDGHIRETTQASAPTTQDEVSKQPCREESFRLGLFDSSHLQDPLQALAMESTQAFVSVEATQLYAAPDTHANKSSSANDSELEATQAYGEEEEPAGCSDVPDRGGRGDFSLEPTQAYVSDPYHDSEEETDDDERRAIATDETQPFYFPTSATLATAETQPMCAPEEEEVVKFPVPSAVRVVRPKNETEERGEPGEAVTSQERPFREVLPLAETQPMCTGEDSQSDDEDSFPGSEAFHGDSSVAETQLMTTGEDEESISFLARPRRKAKPVRYLEEDTQRLAVCESSLFETQPMNSGEGGDGVDSLPEAGDLKSRQQRSDVDKNEPDISPMKKQGEPSLGEEGEKKEHERIHLEIKEEKERIEAENAQRLRFERERAEREKTERERKEQEERAEKRQKETEEKERLELERAEREHKEKLAGEKHARMSSDGKKQEKKEMWESERREHDENLEREVQHHSGRQESEAKEPDGVERSEKGGITEEKVLQEQKEEDKAKVSTRGRRAARRTAATQPTPMNDDVPARRTRSRSNSSNSVSSERSASSIHMQESGGRGRGRGARRTSDAPPAVASRSSNRRKTVAAHPTQVDSWDVPGVPGGPSRPNSSNSSLNQSSQGRGRVSRRRPRGGTAEEDSVSPAVRQSDLETTTRGRKNTKPESCLETEKADAQQATAARGRWRSGSNGSGSAEAEGSWNQGQRSQEGSKRNVRGRSQNSAKREALVLPGSPAASKPDETKELRKGRKRESEADTEDDPGSSAKLLKGEEKEPASGEAEEAANQQEENEVPVQAKRRGRASAAQTKKVPKAADDGPGVKERNKGTVERAAGRGRGRLSVAQKKTKEEQPDPEAPVDQRARVLEPEVRSPASGGSRKRQAPVESSPLTKTLRSSSLSPGVRSRMLSHTFKVLFTCVVDEAGERVLARLGGSMAKGVADMNCLVTDKVRRTVKFLCAVAKGIPVVTTQWLEKVSFNVTRVATETPPPVTLTSWCFPEREGRRLPASQFLCGEG
ncbi:unnamed protein product [Tetraodon nigroviridis]|uniref:(spotted green pufferfish) hypothetical protein n=1 Tax=Tetraodon nigroviridis TaxID=99883 RepID=Q4SNH0_TETNG|nr:unnamed protein product [Tetraodon nigroviridis]